MLRDNRTKLGGHEMTDFIGDEFDSAMRAAFEFELEKISDEEIEQIVTSFAALWLSPTDEPLEARVNRLAQAYNMRPDDVKNELVGIWADMFKRILDRYWA
jgi:hypothetical protein